jgi:carboxysome shell carbonic anhydrase
MSPVARTRAYAGRTKPWSRPTGIPWVGQPSASAGETPPEAPPPLAGPSDQTAHPLADAAVSEGLRRRADVIESAFAAIDPVLRSLAPGQFDPGFPAAAAETLRARLGLTVAPAALQATWTDPLDLRALQAHCVLETFRRLVEHAFDRDLARFSEGEPVEDLIRRWGFHAIDITPCADGRLSGVVDYILRVPPSVVTSRKSYAGAMFDLDESIRQWEIVELRRWREGLPNRADAPTRYLKIGVYHFSVADPTHEGCAAHGSDGARAAGALLARLEDFALAVRRRHGPAASPAILMIGVDTDSDAIRVHVPGADGRMAADRYIDNRDLHETTRPLAREAAKTAIREAVARAAGAASDDPGTEGMRWFCGYLLKNNLGQVEAVRLWHGGAYADGGHTERLIVVGDAIDDVQLRNLAFQAQMDTIEEGAPDLLVGVSILRKRLEPQGLAVPVLAHVRYDPQTPGARDRAIVKANRLRTAILASHPALAERGFLHVHAVVRAGEAPALEPVAI